MHWSIKIIKLPNYFRYFLNFPASLILLKIISTEITRWQRFMSVIKSPQPILSNVDVEKFRTNLISQSLISSQWYKTRSSDSILWLPIDEYHHFIMKYQPGIGMIATDLSILPEVVFIRHSTGESMFHAREPDVRVVPWSFVRRNSWMNVSWICTGHEIRNNNCIYILIIIHIIRCGRIRFIESPQTKRLIVIIKYSLHRKIILVNARIF